MTECDQFILMPPQGAIFEETELHREILDALRNRFPTLTFYVYLSGERDEEAFGLIPVLSGNPNSPFSEPFAFEVTDLDRLHEIGAVLHSFTEAGGRRLQ